MGNWSISSDSVPKPVYKVFRQEFLFADDTALTSHSEEGLQHLVDKLSHTCKEFG